MAIKRQAAQKDFSPKNAIYYVFFVNGFVILLSLLVNSRMPPQIPLFYGLPTGNEQLASNWFLPLPSFVALLIAGLNLFLISLIENEFLRKILVFSAIAAAFFSTITTLKIIFLVGNF